MARKKKNFNWGNFPIKFLKSVLYSEKTPVSNFSLGINALSCVFFVHLSQDKW